MGLRPLEFTDCLLDSPYFRDSIYDHEKELDDTNDAIKALIKECRNLLKALETLSKAQRSFCSMLKNFKMRYIGEVDIEDDPEYEDAFPLFAEIVEKVEEERDRMLYHANVQLIEPLDRFRKEQIGNAKDEKKKFDKETERVCGLVDAHCKISTKKKDNALLEANAQMEHELRNFRQMSLAYVSTLQEVNEKKKFEFVEIMLAFMYGQATFFHNGHDVFSDHHDNLRDLQYKLQTTRERFDVTRQEAEDLKNKTTRRFHSGELHKGMYARQGYLFVHDKRRGVLGPTWVKHYCMYKKENKILTMIPYTQTQAKPHTNTDTLVVTSCVRKQTEASDRRFLFDITGHDRSQPITLQCLSEEDRKQWLEVMEGKELLYMESSDLVLQNEGVTNINEIGLEFVQKSINAIEKRGLDDQGLYRIAGVNSKFTKLLLIGLDPKQLDKLDLSSDDNAWEVKTITSALKQYFRSLSNPLFTYEYHNDFLQAIKLDAESKRINQLKELLKLIPEKHYHVLNRLMHHLKLVAEHSNHNLMQASNLGVVLGPTLMRPKEETMAAIMNIKYQSVVIETMIKEYEQLFADGPKQSLTERQDASPGLTSAKMSKYRAPVPPSPVGATPRRLSARPKQNKGAESVEFLRTASGSSVESLSPSNSVGRREAVPTRPGASNRYSEIVQPFTSPITAEETDNDAKCRRESYSMAMNSRMASAEADAMWCQIETPPNPQPYAQLKPRFSDFSNGPPIIPRQKEWKVRTLYHCVAENDVELSFNSGAVISNVRRSTEDGWLIGCLNGKTGLVPETYCETID